MNVACFLLPALADIGAAGLLADGVQAVGADDPLRLEIARRDRRLDANPVRLAQHRLVRPMRLFRVTRAAGGVSQGVDQDGHGLYMETRAGIYPAANTYGSVCRAASSGSIPCDGRAIDAVHERLVRFRLRFRRFTP